MNVVKELDESQLNFVTLDLQDGEILIAPEEDYILIVLRDKEVWNKSGLESSNVYTIISTGHHIIDLTWNR